MFRGKGIDKDVKNVCFAVSLCLYLCLSWWLSHIFDVAAVVVYAPVFAFTFARHRRWSHFYTKMLSLTPTWKWWLYLLSWSWFYLIFFLFYRRNGDWQNWLVHTYSYHTHLLPLTLISKLGLELVKVTSNVMKRCSPSLCAPLTGLGSG